MKVNPEIFKTVAFVGYFNHQSQQHEYLGSAFIYGFPREGQYCEPVFFVTARHVIDGIAKKGALDTWLRVNLKSGASAWVRTATKSWFTHPTDSTIDVAVVELGTGPEIDHSVFPEPLTATHDFISNNGISPGREIFIMGLFKHHSGKRRNIPIIRVGNIACIDDERISTRECETIAYLIEARSIGGLSGAPVFLNMTIKTSYETRGIDVLEDHSFFLGIILGHYDTKDSAIDAAETDNGASFINMGIAIVTPAYKVREVIDCYLKTGARSHAVIGRFENFGPDEFGPAATVEQTGSAAAKRRDVVLDDRRSPNT